MNRLLGLTLVLWWIGAAWPTAIPASDQHVVVVLDDSGSMASGMRSGGVQKMDAAKRALQTVLASVPDDAEVGVLALNSRVGDSPWIVPLGPVDRARIRQQIGGINAEGSTPLGAAIKDAADALLSAREKYVYGSYRLLIVTDGEASDQYLVDQYLPDIKTRGLITDVIGVDMSGQHSLATQVSTYRRADDPASLAQAIAQVFAETSDQDPAAGESDYDLLAGLSDEVAAAAVQRLSQMNNQPIGQVAASTDAASRDAGATGTSSGAPLSVPPPAAGGGGSGFGSVCFSFFILLLMFVAFMSLVSKFGGRRAR